MATQIDNTARIFLQTHLFRNLRKRNVVTPRGIYPAHLIKKGVQAPE